MVGLPSRRRAGWSRYVSSALRAVPQPVPADPEPQRFPVPRWTRTRARADDITAAPAPLRELRLLPTAGAAWVAAFLAVRCPPGTGWALAGSAALMAVLGLVLAGAAGKGPTRNRRRIAAVARGTAVPLAAAALVCAGAAGTLAERTRGPMAALVSEGAAVSAEFRAVSDARPGAPDQFTGQPRYLVDAVAESATAGGDRFASSATILVVGGKDYSGIRWGDRFSSAGGLQRLPPGNRNLALMRAAAAPDIEPAGGWYAGTTGLRAGFVQAAQNHGASVDGLLPGMVLGDRSSLAPELAQAMKDTGLTHLTAVSGANCSYLLAFIFLLARAARLPRAAAVLLSLTGLAAFVLLVRPDPSVLRAAVMGGLGTLAVLSGRGRLPVALLLLSITVLLGIDPWLCTSYAFILSVCATLGLVVLGPHLVRVLSRWLPVWFAAALAVPVAAQLFCAPVLVLLQPQLPVYSVPANLAVAPVVPGVTIAGMLAVAAVGTLPVLAAAPLMVAAAGAKWVAGTARFVQAVPGALLPWPEGGTGAFLMAGSTAAAVTAVLYLSRRGLPREVPVGRGARPGTRPALPVAAGRRSVRIRPGYAVWAAVLLLVPGGAVLTGRSLDAERGTPLRDWVVAACDVGQGDGLAIRAGPDSAVVIDAGGEPAAMDHCLDTLAVRSVDLFVITHAHLDHYGGTAGVLSGRTVREVGYSTSGPELPEELTGVLAGSAAPQVRLTQGMAGTSGNVHWEVLWPPAAMQSASAGEEDENNASAVLLVSVDAGGSARPLRILLTGDAETEAAAATLAAHPGLRSGVDVLKVAHHGARNGGDGWLRAVHPVLALISVGEDNDYGHPAPQIVAGLESAGTEVARTDRLGTILVTRHGQTLTVNGLPP